MIKVLPADVAAKIAAGEVVERPANVAKELLENSLDAAATEIRVEIRDGGQRLLRITDNGIGIPQDDVALAFERHATSKLRDADDLNQIATFGFRGEALYSIAAVSQVTLTTRAEAANAEAALAESSADAGDMDRGVDADRAASDQATNQAGVRLRIEGGVIVEQGRIGTPPGTVISIENLFYNMPARLKFLRKPATEAGRISAVIQRYALAYPERRFSFVNNGKLIFQSAGTGDVFDVLVKIYGLENAKQMVPIGPSKAATLGAHLAGSLDEDINFMDESARLVNTASPSPTTLEPGGGVDPLVSGYVSLPTLTRANRNNIDLFINHRYIEDRNLTYAVIQAFHTLLPGGRFPIAAIFVELDPAQVDVNVHPQKTQVRFFEDRRVFSAIQKAVRRAIVDNAPVPDMGLPATLHRPIAGSTTAGRPALDSPPEEPGPWAARGEWSERRKSIITAGQQRPLDLYVPPPANPPPLGPEGDQLPVSGEQLPVSGEQLPVDSGQLGVNSEQLPVGGDQSQVGSEQPATGDQLPSTDHQQPTTSNQQPSNLPPLRVVGQVGSMYIVTEGPEGLYLIDQHAAHERILYEKLMAEKYAGEQASTKGMDGAAGHVARQAMLEPLTLHAGSEMAGFVAQYLNELNLFGFEIEPFGGDTFLVRAVPSVLSGQDPLRVLEEIVNGLRDRRNMVGEELEARLVKMICKRASIKAGQLLSDIEMQELVRQLEACQSPRTCPHGRPTMIQLSAGELEKAFGRI